MSSQEKLMSAGKALYLRQVPGAEIAELLGVSTTTVSNWATKGGWREERIRHLTQQKSMQARVYKLIDYQLEVMDGYVDGQRAERKLTSLDKGQIYALRQLLISLSDEPDFATTVTIVQRLVEHLNRQAPDLAKALIPYTNEYIADRKRLVE